jgi:hypothetical protein
LPPAKPKRILGKLLDIGVKRFSSSGGPSALSLGDTDDEFEEERVVTAKLEAKLQGVIKCLDKEIKARRGKTTVAVVTMVCLILRSVP